MIKFISWSTSRADTPVDVLRLAGSRRASRSGVRGNRVPLADGSAVLFHGCRGCRVIYTPDMRLSFYRGRL